jgi:cyclic beta-1,2-glucan synthetase
MSGTRAGVHRYKVEPYVAVADVYSEPPHVGRGGWTWYTGAAGWMYRAGVEWILGIRRRGSVLFIDPCIPRAWRGYEVALRYRSSNYRIVVENPRGATRGVSFLELDGQPIPPSDPVDAPAVGTHESAARQDAHGRAVPLVDDGASHQVRVVIG